MMQLTGSGTPCTGQTDAMEASTEVVFEKSAKGQVRRPTRPEHVIAFEFLKIHYEEDVRAEIPVQKSDVYVDYERHCKANDYKPLVAADFGRILKSMFPNAKDRRLGSRGSSKYCYVGVKRKSENSTKNSNSSPYSAEDLSKAYQSVVCEWASTVLSRRMTSLDELAKYLLRNRFVQTRSCSALTITASLKDTDELMESQPVNKHRETQIKLQEVINERRNKQMLARSGSMDDSHFQHTPKVELTASQTHSTCSTPDPDGQFRQLAMQTSSAPGSRRTSPEHAAMSVNSSACTSPVFNDGVVQKPLYPINCHRNGNGLDKRVMLPGALTPINSQCNSAVGSERNTPVAPQYTNMQVSHVNPALPQYQGYDPRIHSCPSTPLPSYQQHRFDFNPQPVMNSNNPTPAQCMSLPNSARNTPIIPDYQDVNDGVFHPNQQRQFSSSDLYQQQNFGQSFVNFQRVEFGRNNNSAFMPVKDGAAPATQNSLFNQLEQALNTDGAFNDLQTQNDGDELEINELFNIIESNSSAPSAHPVNIAQPQLVSPQEMSSGGGGLDRARPLSAQEPVNYGTSQRLPLPQPPQTSNSNSVIYNLLKSGTTHSAGQGHGTSSAFNQRFRHHSGPQLGYPAAHKTKYSHLAAVSTAVPHNLNTASSVDLNSPPSTPNGNFRPVHTPSREVGAYYGSDSNFPVRTSNPSPAVCMPNRFNNSLVGTMSPPAQPLIKRKRNHSGEKVVTGLSANSSCKPVHPASKAIPAATGLENPDYVARRNLGNQLSSPKVGEDGYPLNSGFTNGLKSNGHDQSSSFHEGVGQTPANHSSGINQR